MSPRPLWSRLRGGLWGGLAAVLAASALAGAGGAATAAAAATGVSYRGKTNQRQPISFRISGGFLRSLDYHILDVCSNGQRINDHDRGFTPIAIRHGRFNETFFDPAHGTKAVIKGSISKRRVKGMLTDRTRFGAAACNGKATFSLPPK